MHTNTAIRTNNADLLNLAKATQKAQAERTALKAANKAGQEMLLMVREGVWDGQPVTEAPKADLSAVYSEMERMLHTDRNAVIRTLALEMQN